MPAREMNPCSFKSNCRNCNMVEMSDRPTRCISLDCEFYMPCNLCGMNVNTINPELGHCNRNDCQHLQYVRENNLVVDKVKLAGGREVIALGGPVSGWKAEQAGATQPQVSTGNLPLTPASTGRRKINRPGEPPDGLNDDEKEYYKQRWEDYEGYYRDPAAYMICHLMILEEIRLDYIQNELIGKRGEAASDMEKAKREIYTSLANLKKQLPEKESERLSDDEKAMGRIYEAYQEELGLRRKAGISRLLSPEAIALVPELPFRLDIEHMLRSCGYSMISVEDAMQKFYTSRDIDDSPHGVMDFLGFKLKSKYALPFKGDLDSADGDDTDRGLHETENMTSGALQSTDDFE